MVLPLVKLGTLALKTACKPIANRLKKEATLHPKFRQFIINFAQVNHRFTTQIQRRIYGHRTDVEIRPLNEEKALQVASDLIGELFVFSGSACLCIMLTNAANYSELGPVKNFDGMMRWIMESDLRIRNVAAAYFLLYESVAGAAVIYEVQRSAKSEAKKEEARRHELEAMKQRDEELAREVETLQQKLEGLEMLAKEQGRGILNIRKPGAQESK